MLSNFRFIVCFGFSHNSKSYNLMALLHVVEVQSRRSNFIMLLGFFLHSRLTSRHSLLQFNFSSSLASQSSLELLLLTAKWGVNDGDELFGWDVFVVFLSVNSISFDIPKMKSRCFLTWKTVSQSQDDDWIRKI